MKALFLTGAVAAGSSKYSSAKAGRSFSGVSLKEYVINIA